MEFSEGNVFFSRGGEREAKVEESSGSGAPSPPLCVAVLFFSAALQAADGKKSLHEVTRADRDFCKTHFHGLTISVHKPIGGGGGYKFQLRKIKLRTAV